MYVLLSGNLWQILLDFFALVYLLFVDLTQRSCSSMHRGSVVNIQQRIPLKRVLRVVLNLQWGASF